MNRTVTLLTSALMGIALTASAQPYPEARSTNSETIPAGAEVRVRTAGPIDARDTSDRRIYTGTVESDVISPDGRVVIPRGANAELTIINTGNRDMAIDMESVSVEGRRYMVDAQDYTKARRDGVGANGRTGKYVGGGALLGTVIGAIAGGGKGAAIGALAGGAAGAGTQVLTRGNNVHIPSETVLTFRLDRPLTIGMGRYSRDNGMDRNGYHYHDNYYRDDSNRTDQRPQRDR